MPLALQVDYLQDARLMKISFWKFKTFLVDNGVALDETNKTSTKKVYSVLNRTMSPLSLDPFTVHAYTG